MKCVALIVVLSFVSLLSGCSSNSVVRGAMENGKVYIGGSLSVEKLNINDDLRSIRDSQLAGNDLSLLYIEQASTEEAQSFQFLVGYQVAHAMDLEATVFTNQGSSFSFSSSSRVESLSGSEYSTQQYGRLRNSGATLSTLLHWRFNEFFSLYARLGGSYNSTVLDSKLERAIGERAGNQVKYRTKRFEPLWGAGLMMSDVIGFEYQVRKIPLGSTASETSNSSNESFEAAKISDGEMLHSIMLTIRFGLKNLFN